MQLCVAEFLHFLNNAKPSIFRNTILKVCWLQWLVSRHKTHPSRVCFLFPAVAKMKEMQDIIFSLYTSTQRFHLGVSCITAILYLSLYLLLRFCISKENHYFLIYLPGKLQAASYPSRITFGTVMNEYSQSSQIFQLGRRFSIRLDIILNEKSMHKVLDSSYAQEKIRNVFLKYSQENRLLFLLWLGFVHKCFPSK